MKKILIIFFGFVGIILFFTVKASEAATVCDQITWDSPHQKSGSIFTFSGNIANCSGTRHVRLEIQYRRTDNSDPVIQPVITPLTITNGALSTDIPITGDKPVNLTLILYDVDATDAVILNPDCSNQPPALQNNSNCKKVYYVTVTPGGTVDNPGNTTPGTPGTITCNNTFTYDGDQALLVCPKDCPTLVPLQGKDYQCSTQDLVNVPIQTTDLKLSVRAKDSTKDTYILNQAYATYIGASRSASTTTSPSGGSNIPPNDNTCNGHYIFGEWPNISQLKNFGDPECTMDEPQERDTLYTMLKQQDPTHADDWFNNIIPCETGHTYSPNSFNGNSPASGAYGLFQMGGSGQLGTKATSNGNKYDIGDVVWQQQVANAISYNNQLLQQGLGFQYWECAKYLW